MKVLFRKLPVRPSANALSPWTKAAGASPPSHAKRHPGTDCSVPGCPAYLPVSSQPDPLPETPQPGPWYRPQHRCSGSPARLRCARSSGLVAQAQAGESVGRDTGLHQHIPHGLCAGQRQCLGTLAAGVVHLCGAASHNVVGGRSALELLGQTVQCCTAAASSRKVVLSG